MLKEMVIVLSEKTVKIVKSTVPVLEEYGTTITSTFYKRMFQNHPELLNYFNHVNQRRGTQPTALANTVIAAGKHIDEFEIILPAVKQIAHKHRALSIRPEHYPIVGENLLAAIKEVLGEAATDEILQAWAEAYEEIANVFIQVEGEMYREASLQKGGWTDFKAFTVIDKIKESEVITSFYLKPTDGASIPTYLPGQYITVRLSIPDEKFKHNRHYSLSCAPGNDYFRISVKRENECEPLGVVSNYLHDHVHVGDQLEISAPAGDFVLNTEETEPVAFISGGVGITPLLSMFETLVKDNSEREITFIQAAKNENVQAFGDYVKELAKKLNKAKVYTVLEQKNLEETDCDHIGYIDLSFLQKVVSKNTICYLCGPVPFMKAVVQILNQMGLPEHHIRYEFFGPKVDFIQ